MPVRDIELVLAVLRQAIHNEIAGQRFYNDASFYCIDPWAKDMFANLAREEEGHTQLLLVEYDSLETQGQWIDPDVAMQGGVQADITRFTFSEDEPVEDLFSPGWSVEEAVDRRSDDLAALAFGIGMEQQAILLYGEQLAESAEPAAQKAYRFLVADERRHHSQLKDQWERLAGIPYDGT